MYDDVPIFRHPTFYCDVIFIHLKTNEEGVVCQEIFDALSRLESYQQARNTYILETHHVQTKLLAYAVALMTHPFQRESQDVFLAKLDVKNL